MIRQSARGEAAHVPPFPHVLALRGGGRECCQCESVAISSSNSNGVSQVRSTNDEGRMEGERRRGRDKRVPPVEAPGRVCPSRGGDEARGEEEDGALTPTRTGRSGEGAASPLLTPSAEATKRGGAGRRPMRGCSAMEGGAQRRPRAMRREGGVGRVADATDGPETSESQSEEASPNPPRATQQASV